MKMFEIEELKEFDQLVYFEQAVVGETDPMGLDDEEGYLVVKPGDHLLYRFEVKSILGKGSFAQVVKAIDHKTLNQVAIKINRNTEIDHKFA